MMTYGISLINEAGVPALDMEHQTLRVYEAGTTIIQAPLYDYFPAGHVGALPGVNALWKMYVGDSYGPSQTTELIDVGGGRFALVPEAPENSAGGWSAFYQITTGMQFSVETELDLDPAVITPRTYCLVDGARPYKLTAPVSKPSYTETYGAQIFNAAGEKVFDSRDDFLAIRYAFIIPKAIVDGVMAAGVPRTITLPEAMPNAWFSIPFLCCWEQRYMRTSAGGVNYFRRYRLTITQTSATEVTLTRWDSGELNLGTTMPPMPIYTHDIVVFVARNP